MNKVWIGHSKVNTYDYHHKTPNCERIRDCDTVELVGEKFIPTTEPCEVCYDHET